MEDGGVDTVSGSPADNESPSSTTPTGEVKAVAQRTSVVHVFCSIHSQRPGLVSALANGVSLTAASRRAKQCPIERVLAIPKRSVVAFDRSLGGPDRKQTGFHID
jgi:hypothetical protein